MARTCLLARGILLYACLLATAQAGGLDVPAFASGALGTANANGAEARDASVIYYNPAGMTRLRGTHLSGSLTLLNLRGKVTDTGTTRTPPPGASNSEDGAPVSEDPQAQGRAGSFWPQILATGSGFISHQINENTHIGLGVFAPAGGNINYKKNWSGRYFVDSLAAETLAINPSAAYRFDDRHSVGIGFSVLAAHLRTIQQIDVDGIEPYLIQPVVGLIGDAQPAGILDNLLLDNLGLGDLLPDLTIPAGTTFGALDPELKAEVSRVLGSALLTPDSRGSAKIEMYGYGLGYNLGYLYEHDERTRLSLAYRSKNLLRLRGELDWDLDEVTAIIPLPDTRTGDLLSAEELLDRYLRPDTTAKTEITIPARLSLSVFRQVTPRLELMADYTFIESSVLDEIRIELSDQRDPQGNRVQQGDGAIALDWRDSFRAAIGANYHWNDRLMLRSGFSFDLTPIPSPRERHPATPDANRYAYAIGANYRVNRQLSIDGAYSLVYIEGSESEYRLDCRGIFREQGEDGLSEDPGSCTGNGGTFRGRFDPTVIHLLGVQLNYRL